MRSMLVFWLVISAIRSIFVHLVSTLTGFLICACSTPLKSICFEFGVIKAAEIACSVYFWINVHDFYYLLRSKSLAARNVQALQTRLRLHAKETKPSTSVEADDSDSTNIGSIESILDQLELEGWLSSDDLISKKEASSDSILAQIALEWFLKSAIKSSLKKLRQKKTNGNNPEARHREKIRRSSPALDEEPQLQTSQGPSARKDPLMRFKKIVDFGSTKDDQKQSTSVQTEHLDKSLMTLMTAIEVLKKQEFHRKETADQSCGPEGKDERPIWVQSPDGILLSESMLSVAKNIGKPDREYILKHEPKKKVRPTNQPVNIKSASSMSDVKEQHANQSTHRDRDSPHKH